MNIEITKDGSKIIVDIEVPHIKGTRRIAREFRTSDVLQKLKDLGYNTDELYILSKTVIYNYQTLERCKGRWVFGNRYEEAVSHMAESIAEEEDKRILEKLLNTLESRPKPKPKRTRKKKDE